MKPVVRLPPVTVSEHEGVRYLHLGSIWVQGAMRLRQPQKIELDYIQRMLASLLWRPSELLGQGHAVQLGLGAGAITRFTCQQLGMATTVVEINPAVIDIGMSWFALPAAACRPVRPRSRSPGAGQRRFLQRLPRHAGQRRRDERQPFRPRCQF
jgi:spermidine synthase